MDSLWLRHGPPQTMVLLAEVVVSAIQVMISNLHLGTFAAKTAKGG